MRLSGSPFTATWLDIKLGIRMLLKYPVLSLSGITGISIAVAIAAGGFSVVQRNLLATSLPLEEGDRIVAVELWNTLAAKLENRILGDFREWRALSGTTTQNGPSERSDALRSIHELSAYRTVTPNLFMPGVPPESVRVAAMTASGFDVARVRPLLGRLLTEADGKSGAEPVALIAEDIWRNRFGADPAILHRSVQLGSSSRTIVGVMPKGFAFPVNHQFWIPLPLDTDETAAVNVFGRLAPGASIDSARAELATMLQRAAQRKPQTYEHLRAQVAPYSQAVLNLSGADDMAGILAMQGLVVSLLVLVCLNVAILVYTRTAMRTSEIGLRTALGASRGRIVAQLFAEAFVLAAVAAAVGIAMAALALRLITGATAHLAAELPFWLTFELSPEGVLYAAALSVVAAVIVGVVPGLQATGSELEAGLRVMGSGGSGMKMGKVWTVLIVAQVCFAVTILPPSVSQGWKTLQAGLAGPGFAAEEFLSARLGSDVLSPERLAAKQAEVVRRLEAEPGVVAVTSASAELGDEAGAKIEAQGLPGETLEAGVNHVGPSYWSTFGVPIVAGRSVEDESAVVVNRAVAQRMFQGNALGQRIRYSASGRWYEIVGVVNNFPMGVSPKMDETPLKVYHVASGARSGGSRLQSALTIRTKGAPAAFGPRLREIVAGVDADLHLRDIRSVDEALRKEQWIRRLEAGVLLSVTVAVVLLSSAGIYALMSFTVSQRRREIGIRMALGAGKGRILSSIFSRALLQLGAGAALGAVFGIAIATSGSSVDQADVLRALAAVIAGTLMLGVIALLGPTVRSLRIQPTEALREQ